MLWMYMHARGCCCDLKRLNHSLPQARAGKACVFSKSYLYETLPGCHMVQGLFLFLQYLGDCEIQRSLDSMSHTHKGSFGNCWAAGKLNRDPFRLGSDKYKACKLLNQGTKCCTYIRPTVSNWVRQKYSLGTVVSSHGNCNGGNSNPSTSVSLKRLHQPSTLWYIHANRTSLCVFVWEILMTFTIIHRKTWL